MLQSLRENRYSNNKMATLPYQSVTTYSDARLSTFSIPEAIESELDEIIPTLLPEGKGPKIDKITTSTLR